MSLNPQDLKTHCQQILKLREIRNKIVVLCEGEISKSEWGINSPATYRRNKQLPDSSFYQACVPPWWREKRPRFINCGDRADVINTYFKLLESEPNLTNSYLNPNLLFAIIDLDLQNKEIHQDYPFPSTEEIFKHLYKETKVNPTHLEKHRIWTTGLIYKEAYFFMPELQALFTDYPNPPTVNGNSLVLNDLYLHMAEELTEDANLNHHFELAIDRLHHQNLTQTLETQTLQTLQTSWQQQFNRAKEWQRRSLILALLMIKQVKPNWQQIEPSIEWSRPVQNYRDELSLAIGRFYSQQSPAPSNHIPYFFKCLNSGIK
jgi:hypothetical protein